MNLGQAVAVCLYELVRGRRTTSAKTLPGKKEKAPATSGDVERLTQALLKFLRASGYVKPRTLAAEEQSRRLLRRMEMSANDAEVWLGMMRQIAWKLSTMNKDYHVLCIELTMTLPITKSVIRVIMPSDMTQ